VPITSGATVTTATRVDGHVRLRLDDGTERRVDHVLLATGFRVDIASYGFLSPDVLRAVRQVNGYPRLSATFESSIPGLYFVGAPAAWSFGPLMRFVAGTAWAAQALARGIARRAGTAKP
jgi:NADPH-dependent 2,4-dienoyl-CoA reductase/sulfur reductase-like enzyme